MPTDPPKIVCVGREGSANPALLAKLLGRLPGSTIIYVPDDGYLKMLERTVPGDVVLVPWDDAHKYLGFLRDGSTVSLVQAGYPDDNGGILLTPVIL